MNDQEKIALILKEANGKKEQWLRDLESCYKDQDWLAISFLIDEIKSFEFKDV